VTVVTKNPFLQGQPNRKLRDRQFTISLFTIEEEIRKQPTSFICQEGEGMSVMSIIM
jgi:hypothetical protein